MNRYTLLVCLVACSLAGTEAALDAEGIVGGEVSPRDKYGYQIALQTQGRGFCGGSIVGDRHVLTAAHCVTNSWGAFSTFPIQIVAGAFDLDRKGSDVITIDVEKVYIPKEYESITDVEDIAVIKLKEPLDLDKNDRLSKLELPEAGNSYAGEEATVTGYGWSWVNLKTDPETGKPIETGGVVSHKKKFAITEVLTTDDCQKNYPQTISHKEICARVNQRNSKKLEGVCAGDSGGPLVYNDSVIIGVVSTSPLGCDESKAPAIYTRVSEFLDFVKNAISDNVNSSIRVYEPKKSARQPNKKPWHSFLSKLSV